MKRSRFIGTILGATLFLCMFVFTGCSNATEESNVTESSETSKPIVAVTIVPEETFVTAVCGDLVEVVTMVPPGNSPENYEPTAELMQKFEKAALYFSIGVPTEEANIIPSVGDTTVISLAERVAEVYPDRTFDSGERDPHIWLSPKRVKVMIEVIVDEMSKIDPDNVNTYEENGQAYIEELEDLNAQIESVLIDVQSKNFIVYHPAFGYLADDYGLTMYALEEDGKEATAKHLQEMIDLAKEKNIKVIFYQEEIDSSQSQSFAEEIGGKTIQLAPLAEDYINNLKNMAVTMAEVME